MKYLISYKFPLVVGLVLSSTAAFAQDTRAIVDSLTISRQSSPTAQIGRQDPRAKQRPDLRDEQPNIQSAENIGRSLKAQILPSEAIANGKIYIPPSDLAFYGGWLRPSPPTMDGIPIGNLPPHVPSDFPKEAYEGDEIVTLIKESIVRCRDKQLGARITCYENEISMIMVVSGNDVSQRLLRFTLNRAVDVVHHVLPFAGYNTLAISNLISNFYETMLVQAIAFTNNHAKFCSNFNSLYGLQLEELDESIMQVHVAEFGRYFAQQMYQTAQNSNLSITAQAVLLMRATGYLGWDLASDRRWREAPVRQLMIAVYQLQNSREYQELLDSISSGREPVIATFKSFQNQFYRIRQDLSPKLRRAGVPSLDPDSAGASVIVGLEPYREATVNVGQKRK